MRKIDSSIFPILISLAIQILPNSEYRFTDIILLYVAVLHLGGMEAIARITKARRHNDPAGVL